MAAPQIPHLLSLRGGHGRGRGRGRGGHRFGHHESEEDAAAAKDHVVQATDGDASGSRLSAVELGYMDDPFARAFHYEQDSPRRYPIINRGTYVRTAALDHLVTRFLSAFPSQPKQIISLGAGSDTRWFRLVLADPSLAHRLVYHELDFSTNTSKKIAAMQNRPFVWKVFKDSLPEGVLEKISENGTRLESPSLNVHPVDLRDLAREGIPASEIPTSLPRLPNLDPDVPTLLLSECCLCYVSPEITVSILRTFTTSLIPRRTPLALALYEPIHPHDPFGRVMLRNLATRGIDLPTISTFSSRRLQKSRLEDAGFEGGQGAADVGWIWSKWVEETERERVGQCEGGLDEVEEWDLLAGHYCVAWGWRDGDGGEEESVFWRAWGELDGQEDEVE
ncbi:S-adenosyl-L-methionine-dependent methyltransferase [Lineolata rhizophorae]|uniref:Leucine carboxyl methyltransferase 1 n=1 Tax=Lineolata rhizophorae TaxID=578093 RepID=A0A6A6NUA8_9PEZI|nr:S-adenosyl-L-methionine-dependent methyltransferase [Lineolata rhizophorae]